MNQPAYDDNYDFQTNLSDVDDANEFDTIPPGKYVVQCVQTELKDNASNTGKLVAVEFEVTQGEYESRRIFENFNLQHPNQRAVKIAQGGVKQWVKACGLDENQRLTMRLIKSLEGLEFLAHVKIEKDKKGVYDDQNRIKRYEPLPGTVNQPMMTAMPPGAESAPAPTTVQQPAPQQQSSTGKRPWEQ